MNLYIINNNFLPFIIEFLRKKIVINVPIYNTIIESLEYFIQDNIYRITISGTHYYYFIKDVDIIKLMDKIREEILNPKKIETHKIIDIVAKRFIDDDTFDVRMNSIKTNMELIEYYQQNYPFILYTIDNNDLSKILEFYINYIRDNII